MRFFRLIAALLVLTLSTPADAQLGNAFTSGTSGGSGFSGATAALSTAIAEWDITKVRYYLLDYDGGSDSNVCYIDAAAGSTLVPTGKACKTIEHLMQVFPKFGNGRYAVWLIKPRAAGATYKKIDGTTDDWIDLAGVTGYNYFLTRGSADLTNSVSDRLKLGAITAATGPNGDGSYTVTTGGTTSVFTVAAGSLGATDAMVGYRVRFDSATTTSALRDVSCFINANTGTVVTCGTNLGTAPVNGDTFFVEQPGVRISTFSEVAASSSYSALGILKTTFPGRWTAGLAVTTSATAAFHVGAGGAGAGYAFIATTGATVANVLLTGGEVQIIRIMASYQDEVNTARSVGVGLRLTGGAFLSGNSIDWGSSACMSTGNQCSFGAGSYRIGAGGSYFASTVLVESGTTAGVGNGGFPLFGTTSASDRRTRLVMQSGNTLRLQGSINVFSVDITGAGTGAAITPGGTSTGATATARPQIVAIDDVVGSTSNTAVGIDISTSTNVRLILGQTTANTVTGTGGDIKIAGGAVAAHTDFTLTGFTDANNNTLIGTAGLISGVATLVSNQSGGALAPGDIVRTNGTTNQVTKALADTAAHSSNVLGVMVTSPASTALGYMVTTGVPYVKFAAAPTAGALYYLSAATAGQATTTVPAVSGTNQKLRMGQVVTINGSHAYSTMQPELFPTTSTGAAP